MGDVQTLAANEIQLGSNEKKSFSMNPKFLWKSSSFLNWSRTYAKNGAHFYKPLWIFELIHRVFEFGHLTAINILNASILMKAIGGSWK